MSSANVVQITPTPWKETPPAPGVMEAMPFEDDLLADHYETLRVSPKADEETIERVYHILADRFHPDNPATGDSDTYLRVKEAYETLSSPARRDEYNAMRKVSGGAARFRLRAREFFDGVRGEQNRRLAILCLLYRQRIGAFESPGSTILELEQLTGCTREELNSALWYLCEKKWVKYGEFTQYAITADGFDVVESKLEERREFRAFATLRYYSSQPEAEPTVYAMPQPARSEAAVPAGSGLDNLVHAVDGLRIQPAPEPVLTARAEPAGEAAYVVLPPERMLKQLPAPRVIEAAPERPILREQPIYREQPNYREQPIYREPPIYREQPVPRERPVPREPSSEPERVTLGDFLAAAVITLIGKRFER